VIVLAVRWYLRFGLSFRDVEELLAERGVDVDHVTVYRWVQRLTPLAVVKIGSGIGCGLFINNELERGNSGLAGELGHIPSEPEGQRCSCGNRGCLQTLAGSDAIVGALQQAGRTDVQDIAAAAGLVHGGDRTAREVFQRAGEALGRGLATLLKGLNLEAIGLCVDGEVARLDLRRGPRGLLDGCWAAETGGCCWSQGARSWAHRSQSWSRSRPPRRCRSACGSPFSADRRSPNDQTQPPGVGVSRPGWEVASRGRLTCAVATPARSGRWPARSASPTTTTGRRP
jgi:hypothetical protein